MNFDDALYEVMQRRRYNQLTGRSSNWRERATEWISQRISAILERININLPEGNINLDAVPFFFAAVGGILLAVGIFVIVRMLLQARRPKVHDLAGLFSELAERDYTVAQMLLMSREAENQRLAIRYRFIAVLLSLHERALIQVQPSATNALLLQEITTTQPEMSPYFTEMVDVFHLAWFGEKMINPERYATFDAAGTALVGASHG